jgi:hypothetical protein
MKNSHIIFSLLVMGPLHVLCSEKTVAQSDAKSITAQQPANDTTEEDDAKSPKTPRTHTPEEELMFPASTLATIARAVQQEHSMRSGGGASKQQTVPAHSPLRFMSRIDIKQQRPAQTTAAKESNEDSEASALLETARHLDEFRVQRRCRKAFQAQQLSLREVVRDPAPLDSQPIMSELFTKNSAIATASSATIGGLGIAALTAKALLQGSRRTITDPTEIFGYIKAGIGVAATLLVIGAVCFGITRIRTVLGSMKNAIQHGFETNSLLRSQTEERLQMLEDQLNKICADNNRTNEEIQADITRLSELVQQAVTDISKMLASINKFQTATQQEISVLEGLCLTVTTCNRDIKDLQRSLATQQASIAALVEKKRR